MTRLLLVIGSAVNMTPAYSDMTICWTTTHMAGQLCANSAQLPLFKDSRALVKPCWKRYRIALSVKVLDQQSTIRLIMCCSSDTLRKVSCCPANEKDSVSSAVPELRMAKLRPWFNIVHFLKASEISSHKDWVSACFLNSLRIAVLTLTTSCKLLVISSVLGSMSEAMDSWINLVSDSLASK